MTRRYLLPVWLGSHECTIGLDGPNETVQVDVYNDDRSQVAQISLKRDQLIPVAPPLPPEPVDGTFALVEYDDPDDGWCREIWERQGDEWKHHAPGVYQRVGRDWEELHDRGTVTVLVRDPAADAPELPFVTRDRDGDLLQVKRAGDLGDIVHVRSDPLGSCLTPVEARQHAAALLRAAHEAEAVLGC